MLRPSWLQSFRQLMKESCRPQPTQRPRGSRRRSPIPALIEVLEPRVVLSAAPVAFKQFGEQASAFLSGGVLSAPSADAPVEIAKRVLASHAVEMGVTASDVTSFRVTSTATSKSSGLTHVYLRQQLNGIDVEGGDANVSVMRDGRVLSMGSRLIPNLAARATSVRSINASQTIQSAAAFVGIASPQPGAVQQSLGGASESLVFAGGNVSEGTVPTKLVYQLGDDGALHLAWNLNLQVPGSSDWFDMNVDAATGRVLSQSNWTHYSNAATAALNNSSTASGGSSESQASPSQQVSSSSANGVANSGTFNVYAVPNVDAPNDGNRSLQVNPADPAASPFGWNDTNGAAGAEFTDTRGNNVSAQEDADDNDSGGFRPSGGASLNFDFPLDLTQGPSSYQSAAITQLFYANNVLHDIHYQYGFDEASGNFQLNNYGNGGLGNDAVQADAQDGSGTDNANFGTPPDGQQPRMQQYVFTITTPQRDSDLDNGIIIHEYGHGVSTRLTGGAANSNSLDALQSGGMGEGWGDFWGLMFSQRASDTQNQAFGIGTYVLGQPNTGAGIRRNPYSFNLATNPLTYNDFNTSNEVHDSGEIWASALWDLNWLLINKHGFNADLYAGNGGNNLTLQLVMDGLKLQPANPSFLDGRDAILAADQALTGGANATEIWTAFARRGMGFSASDGGSANSAVVTAAFDGPPTGTLAGIVYNDTDADGIKDAGEALRTSWRVYLDQNGNGVFDQTLTTTTVSSANVPVNIDDNATVTSTLTVAGLSAITDINVQLSLNHTFDGDLDIFLVSPAGTRIELTTDNGSSGDNFQTTVFDDEAAGSITSGAAPFTGSFRPEGLLSALDGQAANGLWTLEITDDAGGDTGVLNSWSITLSNGLNETSRLTDTLGAYAFTSLAAGTYAVRDVLQAGYQRTIPALGLHDVSLIPNQTRSDLNFGNRSVASSAPPTILNFTPNLTYVGNALALLLDTDVTVSDVDSPDFAGGSLKIYQNSNASSFDRLEIRNQGTAAGQIGVSGANVTYGGTTIGMFTGGSGTAPLLVTLNASSNSAKIQALMRNVTFRSITTTPSTLLRTIRAELKDGDGGTRLVSKTITVTVPNQAPTILNYGPVMNYIRGSAAVLLDADVTVTDIDSANFGGGSLKVYQNNNAHSSDKLLIRNQGTGAGQIGVSGANVTFAGTLIGAFTGGTGATALVVTLNTSATPAAVQALLRNVTFSNSTTATTALRTVRVALNDGDGATRTVSKSITVTIAAQATPALTLATLRRENRRSEERSPFVLTETTPRRGSRRRVF